jgi:bacterioferritin-associated ferredoxin
VDQAIRRGARTPKQVLAQHGHEPQCCRCLKEIAGRIKEARSQPEAGFARVVVE